MHLIKGLQLINKATVHINLDKSLMLEVFSLILLIIFLLVAHYTKDNDRNKMGRFFMPCISVLVGIAIFNIPMWYIESTQEQYTVRATKQTNIDFMYSYYQVIEHHSNIYTIAKKK